MATIYKVDGVDLDDILAPRGGATPAAPVVYSTDGQNLSDRYAPVSQGSAAADTGYKSGGVDLGQIFAAIGTVTQWLNPWNDSFNSEALSLNNELAEATTRLRFTSAGEFIVDQVTTNQGGQTISSTPIYFLPAGANPADVEIRATQQSGDTISNPISDWEPLTATRSVSLTATADNGEGTVSRAATVQIEARLIADPGNNTTGLATLSANATSET